MKKVIKAAAAILCALGVGGGILSCSGGTNYVGTSGSSTTTTPTTTTSGTVYAWNFSTTDLVTVPAYDKTGTTEISKGTLQAAATYESTPAGLTMSLANGSYFNKVSPAGTVSSSYTTISADASAGYIEPDGSVSTELTVSVKGPFTATMLCGANSSSDKTDRYAYIKVDGAEVAAPNKSSTTLSATGEKLTYSYTGTDTVTVAFGSTKIVRIFDIKIETENGNGTGKTAGQVLSSANFASHTSNVTNDDATLGLTGTSVSSSDVAVATASISGGNVVITSVSAGTATITVTDASSHEATIAATVNATGAITTSVTKYVPAGVTTSHILDVTLSGSGTNSDWQQLGTSIFYSDKLVGNRNSNTSTYSGVGSFTPGAKMAQITGGKLGNTSNLLKCGIKFTTTGPATLTAYCESSNSGGTLGNSVPDLWVADASNKGSRYSGATISIEGVAGTLGTSTIAQQGTINQVVITIDAAGTYYFGDSVFGKFNIYSLDVVF